MGIKFNRDNLYDQSNDTIQSEYEHIIAQLSTSYIICGDFNAHHTLWGGTKTDKKGKELCKSGFDINF